MIGSYLSVAGSPTLARGRMLAAVPRLAVSRSSIDRALARALAATALGRFDPGERRWIERVEDRRRDLVARRGETQAGFARVGEPLPEWAPSFDRPIPMAGATTMLSIPPLWGRFLIRLVRDLRPRSCLELGTAFGISTAFQAAGLELNGSGRMASLDAARQWAAIAGEGLSRLGLESRVEIQIGQIARTLPDVLDQLAPVDYVFVDAEHQEEPTVRYFETIVPHLSASAVVVFDDIGFPRQMRRAWKRIRSHPAVASATGLGRMGVVTVSGSGSDTASQV